MGNTSITKVEEAPDNHEIIFNYFHDSNLANSIDKNYQLINEIINNRSNDLTKYFSKGIYFMFKKEYCKALLFLFECIFNKLYSYVSLTTIADISLIKGEIDKAQQFYLKSHRIKPNYLRTLSGLYEIDFKNNQIYFINKLPTPQIKIENSKLTVFSNLSDYEAESKILLYKHWSHLKQGIDLQNIENERQEVLEFTSKYGYLQKILSQIYFQENLIETGLEILEKAFITDKSVINNFDDFPILKIKKFINENKLENTFFYYINGYLKEINNDFNGALADYSKIQESKPDYKDLLERLIALKIKTKDYTGAANTINHYYFEKSIKPIDSFVIKAIIDLMLNKVGKINNVFQISKNFLSLNSEEFEVRKKFIRLSRTNNIPPQLYLDELIKYLSYDNTDPEIFELTVKALLDSKNINEASIYIDQYVDLFNNQKIKLLLAEYYYKNDDKNKLIKCLEDILSHISDDIEILKIIGNTYIKIQEYYAAQKIFSQLSNIDPQNKDFLLFKMHCELRTKEKSLPQTVQNIYIIDNQAPSTIRIDDYRIMEEIYENLKNPWLGLFLALSTYYSQKNIKKAISILINTLELYDKFEEGYLNLAILYGYDKEFSKSEEQLRKLISINPNHIAGIILLSNICRKLQKDIEAVQLLENAVKEDNPKDDNIQLLLALAALYLLNRDKSKLIDMKKTLDEYGLFNEESFKQILEKADQIIKVEERSVIINKPIEDYYNKHKKSISEIITVLQAQLDFETEVVGLILSSIGDSFSISIIYSETNSDVATSSKIKQIIELIKDTYSDICKFSGISIQFIWSQCLQRNFENLELIADSKILYDNGLLTGIEILWYHKTKFYDKFSKYVVTYALFGSQARATSNKFSDIDIWLILDDTDLQKISEENLINQARKISYDLLSETIKERGIIHPPEIHIQLHAITMLWNSLKSADSNILSFLNDAVPFYDRGTFIPWKKLLDKKAFIPSSEIIYQKLISIKGEINKCDEAIHNINKDNILSLCYYIAQELGRSALALWEVPPPPPNLISKRIRENFSSKLIEDDYIDQIDKIVDLKKKTEYGKYELTINESLNIFEEVRLLYDRFEKFINDVSIISQHRRLVKKFDQFKEENKLEIESCELDTIIMKMNESDILEKYINKYKISEEFLNKYKTLSRSVSDINADLEASRSLQIDGKIFTEIQTYFQNYKRTHIMNIE